MNLHGVGGIEIYIYFFILINFLLKVNISFYCEYRYKNVNTPSSTYDFVTRINHRSFYPVTVEDILKYYLHSSLLSNYGSIPGNESN